MGALFDAVRASVTARDAAEMYGVGLDRSGRARCVWHDDKHPSLSFKNGRCHCFACGAGGSSIDLTAQLFGLDAVDAARKLNADFRLGLREDRPYARPQGPTLAQRRAEFEDERRKRYGYLCAVEDQANDVLETYQAENAWDNLTFSTVLAALSRAQDELEALHAAEFGGGADG